MIDPETFERLEDRLGNAVCVLGMAARKIRELSGDRPEVDDLAGRVLQAAQRVEGWKSDIRR